MTDEEIEHRFRVRGFNDPKWLKEIGFSRHMQAAGSDDLSWHGGDRSIVWSFRKGNPMRTPPEYRHVVWFVDGRMLDLELAPQDRWEVLQLMLEDS